MKKYGCKIDVENQRFVIVNEDMDEVAYRNMPMQKTPNPGKEALMSYAHNMEAWEEIVRLVDNSI